ncbi:hypothetical protein GCM10027456_68930 [Kineosporia babensis]
MINVLRCTEDVTKLLEEMNGRENEGHRRINVLARFDLAKPWSLGFFHDGRDFMAVAAVRARNRSGALDVAIEVTHVYLLQNRMPIGEGWIPLQTLLKRDGASGSVDETKARQVIPNIRRLGTSYDSAALDILLAWIDSRELDGSKGSQLAIEQDSLLLLLRNAHLDHEAFASWGSVPSEYEGFLSGFRRKDIVVRPRGKNTADAEETDPLEPIHDPQSPFPRDVGQTVLEDHLIDADIRTLAHWFEEKSTGGGHTEWRTFRNRTGSQVMHVMSSNRTRVEERMGVDLVYWNQTERSYVLIQYKKMTYDDGPNQEWFYRPDRHLHAELSKMAEAEPMSSPDGPDSFRLSVSPSYVKLCEQSVFTAGESQWVEGMYLPAAQMRDLVGPDGPKGPHGGSRLTYSNVGRYLNNSLFFDLLTYGHIGSGEQAGVRIAELLVNAQENQTSVMVGVHRPAARRKRR